jgi:prolyl 4-hydroxylase
MRPKQGSALSFFPAFVDGTPDDRTLHKSEVAGGKKVIAQCGFMRGVILQ